MTAKKRMTMLVTSIGVALGAGTNYVFSQYSTQLGARLHINHTKLNLIALAGNMGVYSSGPIWGRIVDARGPRIGMAAAFFLLLIGYGGMKHMYDTGDSIGTATLALLMIFSYMTGAGGNSGLTAAVNATAKSFPDTQRASATGLVLSGFGLSAFFFSSISRLFFHGDTSTFLLVLSLGTSLPMVIGFLLVRAVPPTSHDHAAGVTNSAEPEEIVYGRASDIETVAVGAREGSRTPLLREQHNSVVHERNPSTPVMDYIPDAAVGVELSPTRSLSRRTLAKEVTQRKSSERDISGRALWCTVEFWVLFLILSLLSGTGLMYINNVGSMAQALYSVDSNQTGGYEGYQSTQVSSVSLTNCLGRIFIGIVSDFMSRTPSPTASRFSLSSLRPLPRHNMLILVSILLLTSQLVAISINSVENLWIASLILGLSYGSIFGIYPTLCIEYFGLAHFSENWGFISLAPMAGGNIFSVAFGKNFDAHSGSSSSVAARAGGAAADECALGRACYVDSLYLTTAGCIIALALSIFLSWRDRRRIEGVAGYENIDTRSSDEDSDYEN